MKSHISAVHEGVKPFKCDICDQSFAQVSNMKRHFASFHNGVKPFKCDICNERFPLMRKMKRHMFEIHEGNELFRCTLCEFSCTRKNRRDQHFASCLAKKPCNHMFTLKVS